MNYKLQDQSYTGPNQVVMTRSNLGRNIGVFVFLLIGIPALVLSLLVLLSEPDRTSFGIAGFGAVFTAGGLLLLSLHWPKRFIFDNDVGALLVEEKGKDGVVNTPLPYDEIEGFQVRTYFTSNASGSSSGSRSRPQYSLDLLKTDGAMWMLYTSGNEVKAQEMMGQLVARVDLEKPFSGELLEQQPQQFSIAEKGSHTELRWKRKSELNKVLGFLIVAVGMGMLFYGFASTLPSFMYWIVGGFLGLIGFSMVYNVIASVGKYHVVKVSGHEVAVSQTGLPIAGSSFTMRTHEIASIQFNFSLTDYQQVLNFLRADEVDLFAKAKSGNMDVGDLFSMIRTLMGINKLQMGGHTVGEMLYVEHLLQDLICERTGQAPE